MTYTQPEAPGNLEHDQFQKDSSMQVIVIAYIRNVLIRGYLWVREEFHGNKLSHPLRA